MARSDSPLRERQREKPYARSPRSPAASPGERGVGAAAVQSPGLLRSVLDRVKDMSPFGLGWLSPGKQQAGRGQGRDLEWGTPQRRIEGKGKAREREENEEGDEDVFTVREERKERGRRSEAGQEREEREDEDEGMSPVNGSDEENQPPTEPLIAPIDRAVLSPAPISAEAANHLLRAFMDGKAAAREGISAHEQRALNELVRRGEEDLGRPGADAGATAGRKRGLPTGIFGPIEHPGSPSGSGRSGKEREGTPDSLRGTGTGENGYAPSPAAARRAAARAAALAQGGSPASTSSPQAIAIRRSRLGVGAGATPDSTPRRIAAMPKPSLSGPSTPAQAPKTQDTQRKEASPGQMTPAAAFLRDMLDQTTKEEQAKTPAKLLVNPYGSTPFQLESQAFHIGSSAPRTAPSTSILSRRARPSTLERKKREREREAAAAAERRAEGEAAQQTGEKRMSDWEMIQASMAQREQKRARLASSSQARETPEDDRDEPMEHTPTRRLDPAYEPSPAFRVPPFVSRIDVGNVDPPAAVTASPAATGESPFDFLKNVAGATGSISKAAAPVPAQPPPAATRPAHPFASSASLSASSEPLASASQQSAFSSAQPVTQPVTASGFKPASFVFGAKAAATVESALDKVSRAHVATLPTFTFTALARTPDLSLALSGSAGFDANAKQRVMDMKIEDLPTFSWSIKPDTPGGKALEPQQSPVNKPTGAAAPASATSGGWGFFKQPPPPPGSWKCGICDCTNKAEASKCIACEGPKPAPQPKAAVPAPASSASTSMWGSGFGPKPVAAGSWTCPTCSITNKPEAAKCAACEEAKPGGAPPANTPAFKPFTGFAPGFAPPPPPSGSWKCSVCDCTNKADASKCIACETAK